MLMRHAASLILTIPMLAGLCASQAQAQLTITPTFDSTWTSGPTADANYVADEATITGVITNVYDKDFTNPINVTIDFSDVNTGLGESLTSYYSSSYSDYLSALTADKQSANGGDGNSAFLSNLPTSGNPVPDNSASDVQYTSAQGRLLNFGTAGTIPVGTGTFDSQISLNMGLIQSQNFGFTSTVEHEINEALGVSSALDGRSDISGTPTLEAVGALDFFRYSAPGVRSFTSDGAAVSYFSDDGGTTPIVYFNQNTGGDYHDWASGPDSSIPATVIAAPQVQDAFSGPGSDPSLGSSEFAALNDIGYNRAAPAAVPEAASSVSLGLLFALGAGAIAIARKRRFTSPAN